MIQGEMFKRQALERVEKGAMEWMPAAERAIVRLARMGDEFTADDVWVILDRWKVKPPTEPRAMGAAMKNAQNAGLIVPTGSWRTSERAECHCRPVQVWRGK